MKQESPPPALQDRRTLSHQPCGQTWPVRLPAKPWTTPASGARVHAALGAFDNSTPTVWRVRDTQRRWA